MDDFELSDSLAFTFEFFKEKNFIRIRMNYSGTYLPEIERISVEQIEDEDGNHHYIPIHEIGDFNERKTFEINQQIIGF